MTAGPMRDELGHELRTLRVAAFASGTELARTVGWSQSRVSKIETGRRLCSEQELDEWLEATRATGEVAARIQDLWVAVRGREALDRAAENRTRDDGGPAAAEGLFAFDTDRTATSTSGLYPMRLPPLVATADYLAALYRSLPEPAEERRLDRLQSARAVQQDSLYREDSEVDLVIGEPALKGGPMHHSTKIAQLDRLQELTGLRNVTIGVVPAADMAQLPMPVSFTVREPPVRVTVTGLTGEHLVDSPAEVAAYRANFDQARSAALHGEQLAELLDRTREEIRDGREP